ncbi:MAG: ribonuclease H family protein [Mediterranea sp.]|jgi:ribonuclease HI|nr:ribonuclease H family protein [Mediterranea sp.]
MSKYNEKYRKKYYVVWIGVTPGLYDTWTECLPQVKGYEGARYRSFSTKEEAEYAFEHPTEEHLRRRTRKKKAPPAPYPDCVIQDSLSVDAACSGNPGAMLYRGVHVASGQEIFRVGPMEGTNNIGEFLAVVHGLAWIKEKGLDMPVYTDSLSAIKWAREKKCGTTLERRAGTEQLFSIIERAEKWLKENVYTTTVIKWETREWGEIPADFGRKR